MCCTGDFGYGFIEGHGGIRTVRRPKPKAFKGSKAATRAHRRHK